MSPMLVLSEYGNGPVPLPRLARSLGIPRDTYRTAIRRGFITPAGGGGQGRTVYINRDDALRFVAAAMLAAVAAVALLTAFRMLRDTGAEVGPDGIRIPLGVTA